MDRISDEKLNAMINNAAYSVDWNKSKGQDSTAADYKKQYEILKELKERREADSKKLDNKAQLRLVRDKCPDMWKLILAENCPDSWGLERTVKILCEQCYPDCKECWDKALEKGDE